MFRRSVFICLSFHILMSSHIHLIVIGAVAVGVVIYIMRTESASKQQKIESDNYIRYLVDRMNMMQQEITILRQQLQSPPEQKVVEITVDKPPMIAAVKQTVD